MMPHAWASGTIITVTLVLLIFIILISATVVRIAAFALELTGMPWEQAKFQALSAFSNSGFTTRESEDVMSHPVRRRVVSTLMVTGNAGIVTTIGTFAGSVAQKDTRENLVNLGVIVGVVVLLFLITRWQGLMNYTRRVIEGWMSKMFDFQPPRAEELLRLHLGYDLVRIDLTADSPVANKALSEIDLKSWRVQVLAIERGLQFHPVPSGGDRLLPGDCLIVYGAADAVYKVFKPKRSTKLSVMGLEGTGSFASPTPPPGQSRSDKPG